MLFKFCLNKNMKHIKYLVHYYYYYYFLSVPVGMGKFPGLGLNQSNDDAGSLTH